MPKLLLAELLLEGYFGQERSWNHVIAVAFGVIFWHLTRWVGQRQTPRRWIEVALIKRYLRNLHCQGVSTFFYFPVAFIQNSDRKSCAAVLLYICRCIRELPQKIVVEGQYTRAPLADGVRCWKFIDPTTKLSELFNQPLRDSWFQTVGLTDVILWYCSLLRMQMLYLGAESSARSGVVWVQCTPWPKSLQITDNQPFFG